MAVTASRVVTVTYAGDVNGNNTLPAAANAVSPGSVTVHTLNAGDNTITVPTGGTTVKGATIVPPAGNAQAITLKGVGGDTGIPLSKLDPTSIAFETAPANFVLNAGGIINILRIFWT
jgi:hypothetical protein